MPANFIQYFNPEYSVIPVPRTVQLLKPSIFRHGDEWCASHINGSKKNIVVYAPTPELAMLAFEQKYLAAESLEAIA